MIEPQRIQLLNHDPIHPAGKYVLYLMHASQRTRFNHALEYTIQRANELALPPVVCYGLMDDFPEANQRHYAFLLQGLADVAAHLQKRKIKFLVRHGLPSDSALHFAKQAAMVVLDRGYLRIQKRFFDAVADHAGRQVVQVETDVVVPVEVTSDHHEFAARTIRPKIHKHLQTFLKPLATVKVKHPSLKLKIAGNLDPTNPQLLLKKLNLDRSISLTTRLIGGQVQAGRLLKQFLEQKLNGYSTRRNDPANQITSQMSAYLHFGQISPLELALAVRDHKTAPRADRDSYLEELIIRRELSINFVHYVPNYDSYESLPAWAKKTLAQHRKDQRNHLYTRHQLEHAQTHDPYWNAAQLEMTRTGFMHNYMRMYWGKKILEWKKTPEEAFADTLHLNNRYFIDGRDPNAFANVAWIFGLHDRPWGPARPVFGLIRYMNAAGLERKFDMQTYVKRWATLVAFPGTTGEPRLNFKSQI